MTGTDILTFFHVFFAIVWVGGGIMLQLLLARAKKAGPEMMGQFNAMAEWTSNHVFMPASFLTLGFGIANVIVSDVFGFDEMWINIGFGGFFLSAVIGMAVLGPTAKKMKALVAERGPNDPVVAHMGRRLDLFGRIDLIILIVVVFVMVTKPG
jgi:uncharacterized membrane protein